MTSYDEKLRRRLRGSLHFILKGVKPYVVIFYCFLQATRKIKVFK